MRSVIHIAPALCPWPAWRNDCQPNGTAVGRNDTVVCSWRRERVYTGAPYEVGYNQMFEELFEALEERLPRRALDHYTDAEVASVPRTKLQMNSNYPAFNPHLRQLSIDYKYALHTPSCPFLCRSLPRPPCTEERSSFHTAHMKCPGDLVHTSILRDDSNLVGSPLGVTVRTMCTGVLIHVCHVSERHCPVLLRSLPLSWHAT